MKTYQLLYFTAPWCGACKVFASALVAFGHPRVQRVVVDIDANPEIARHYNVRNLPTLLLVDEEQEVISRYSGTPRAASIVGWVNKEVQRYEGGAA